MKRQGLNNSQIAKELKISRPSVFGLLKGQIIPPPKEKPKTKVITLYLSIENNSKFVRGKGKVRESIEWSMLREYQMKKLPRNDYELTFTFKDAEHLQKQIDDLHQEMVSAADLRNCYIEANFYDKENDISY